MEIAVKVILRYFWQYLLLLLPYLMVLAGFGVFIVLNGGIVVGKYYFLIWLEILFRYEFPISNGAKIYNF